MLPGQPGHRGSWGSIASGVGLCRAGLVWILVAVSYPLDITFSRRRPVGYIPLGELCTISSRTVAWPLAATDLFFCRRWPSFVRLLLPQLESLLFPLSVVRPQHRVFLRRWLIVGSPPVALRLTSPNHFFACKLPVFFRWRLPASFDPFYDECGLSG